VLKRRKKSHRKGLAGKTRPSALITMTEKDPVPEGQDRDTYIVFQSWIMHQF
jgi:hypothetical protein